MDSMVCGECGEKYTICRTCDLDTSDSLCLVLVLKDPDVCVWGTRVPAELGNEEPIGLDTEDRFVRFDAPKKQLARHDSDIRMVLAGRKSGVAVSLYRHSADIWYRAGSRTMPDEQWDVVHKAGVLIPCRSVIDAWRKLARRKGGKPVGLQMAEWADSVLEEYNAWCNGWSYEILLEATSGDRCTCQGSMCSEFLGTYIRSLSKEDATYLSEVAARLGGEAQKELNRECI